MVGHIKNQIIQGIDNSSTVLVCLTKAYQDKVTLTNRRALFVPTHSVPLDFPLSPCVPRDAATHTLSAWA